MKKITLTALGLLSVGSLSAQSLFDLAPKDSDTESIPLNWTAGVTFTHDDNLTPTAAKNSSTYANIYLGASFLSEAPQDRVEFAARVGHAQYFEKTRIAGKNKDLSSVNGTLSLNWTRRINECLRFISNNSAGYEYEPNYSEGNSTARQTGAYSRWSTDNSFGYRWTERLGTVTGAIYSGVNYEEKAAASNDVDIITLYNDFRYQLSPQSVGTLNYRYSHRNTRGNVGDSQNHFILAGLEHRLGVNTIALIRAGVQIRNVDGSSSSTSTTPSFEGALTTRVNEQFSLRAYGRYSVEDYSRRIGANVFDDTSVLRLGLSGTYQVSQDLQLKGGVNYQDLSYRDRSDGASGGADEQLINAHLGLDLRVSENLYLNGTYNFEDYGSNLSGRAYDRNRFSVGVRATF